MSTSPDDRTGLGGEPLAPNDDHAGSQAAEDYSGRRVAEDYPGRRAAEDYPSRRAPEERRQVQRTEGRGPVPLALALVVLGLLLGALGAFAITQRMQTSYAVSSQYAILPGTDAKEVGQVAYLTPVFAAMANDPSTQDRVEGVLDRKPDGATTTTYPESQLLYTVTVRSHSATNALKTAQAYEKVLIARAAAGEPVEPRVARLSVVTAAAAPEEPEGLRPEVVWVGALAAGCALGLLAALGVLGRAGRGS
ncbi:MAG: hypothetical protein LWW86_08945 [Micrococcales bacterium]|nr:hypothetical protein [Micrococcales bacterium]